MVYLETFEGGSGYAYYNHFSVGDAGTNFRLSVSGFSGTAGDSFIQVNDMMFSTRGRDNGEWDKGNCAEDDEMKGGWWFK